MPSIIVGLLAFAMGLWGLSVWWYSVEELLRGLVPLLLLLFGVVALMAGVSRVAVVSKQDKSDDDLMDLDEGADDEKPQRVAVKKRRAAVKKKHATVKKKAVKKKRVVRKTAETDE